MANTKNSGKKAAEGDFVLVHYKGTFNDGKVFDSSEGREPLKFQLGQGQVIPDFEKAIIGMKPGEKKKIHVLPKNGYGDYNKDLTKAIPRNIVPEKMELKEGMMMVLKTMEGMNINCIVKKITKEEITVDLNHPLAGKELNFEMTLVSIE